MRQGRRVTPCDRHQGSGHVGRCSQTGRIRPASAGQIKSGAVIRTGAHKGQPQCHVDALIKPQILDGNQPLIMVHGHHHIELSRVLRRCVSGTHEHGIGRQRPDRLNTLPTRRFDGGPDDA